MVHGHRNQGTPGSWIRAYDGCESPRSRRRLTAPPRSTNKEHAMVVSPRTARRRVAASLTSRSRARHGWLTAVAAAASGLLVACSSSTSTSSPAPAASASSSQAQPAVTAGPSSTAPASAPSSAPAAGGVAVCQSASLAITVNDGQASGAAGSTYYPLDFTNTSSAPCQMYGFPGVSFVTAATGTGLQIGAAAQRSQAFAKVAVRLAPGGTAHAWLKVAVAGNYPATSCHPVTAHWLRIYPPGETAAGYLGHTFDACSSASAPLLTVLPVRSGQGLADSVP